MENKTVKIRHKSSTSETSQWDVIGIANRAKLRQQKALDMYDAGGISDETCGTKADQSLNHFNENRKPVFEPRTTPSQRKSTVTHLKPRFVQTKEFKARIKFIKRHSLTVGKSLEPETWSIASPDHNEPYRFEVNWTKDKTWLVKCISTQVVSCEVYAETNLSLETAIDDSVTALRHLLEKRDRNALLPNEVFQRAPVDILFKRDKSGHDNDMGIAEFNLGKYTGSPTSGGLSPKLNGEVAKIGDDLRDRQALMAHKERFHVDETPQWTRYCHEHKNVDYATNCRNFKELKRLERHAEFVAFCKSWE